MDKQKFEAMMTRLDQVVSCLLQLNIAVNNLTTITADVDANIEVLIAGVAGGFSEPEGQDETNDTTKELELLEEDDEDEPWKNN